MITSLSLSLFCLSVDTPVYNLIHPYTPLIHPLYNPYTTPIQPLYNPLAMIAQPLYTPYTPLSNLRSRYTTRPLSIPFPWVRSLYDEEWYPTDLHQSTLLYLVQYLSVIGVIIYYMGRGGGGGRREGRIRGNR